MTSWGLDWRPYMLLFSTDKLSAWILAIGSKYSHILRKWFDCGRFVYLLLCPGSVAVLCWNFYRGSQALLDQFSPPAELESRTDTVSAAMIIAIPGVTFPWQQLGYLWIAVAVSMVVHELGHALAAAAHRVQTMSVGFAIVFFFSAAFVELDEHGIYGKLDSHAKSRIWAAGVWHNVVLAGAAGLTTVGLPALISPLYETQHGVVVTSVAATHPLHEVLPPRTLVSHVNGLLVTDGESWATALSDLAAKSGSTAGFCVDRATVVSLLEMPTSCCDPDNNSSDVCFEAYDVTMDDSAAAQVCLNVRKTFPQNGLLTRCSRSNNGDDASTRCSSAEQACVVPRLSLGQSSERLLALTIINDDGRIGRPVYFIGSPLAVAVSVTTSDFQLRKWTHLLPFWNLVPLRLVDVLLRQLHFIVAVSASLGVLNAAPMFYADGAELLRCALDGVCHLPAVSTLWWSKVVLRAGTALFVANLAVAVVLGVFTT